MDKTELQSRLDSVTLDEVGRGFRIVELPIKLRGELKANSLSDIAAVRFTKLNPRRRSKAEQLVIRAYQRDLQNKDILSNAQVLKLVAERGEWTGEMSARKDTLEKDIAQRMTILWSQGIKDNLAEWGEDLAIKAGEFRDMVEKSEKTIDEKATVGEVFDRWLGFSSDMQAEYNSKHAKAQGREVYSHESDLEKLIDSAAGVSLEAVVLVQEIEIILGKLQKFVELTELRKEFAQLTVRHASIFADTVESRRTNNEELARLYVSSERLESADENAKTIGPITSEFDGIYDLPDSVIRWLVDQCFLFHTNVPTEGKDFLETFGFIAAEGENNDSVSPASAESPVPQSSNPDSQAATATVENSSEPALA
jgi:hypothetical protein